MKTYKVELTEEFIKEAHEVACDEWKTKIKDLVPEAFENQFVIGKWYKGSANSLVNFQGDESGYGFNSIGEWENTQDWSFEVFPENCKPATDKEVKEALIKEAKKRGLVKGAKIQDLHGCLNYTTNDYHMDCGYELYSEKEGMGGACLFSEGQWAEPIEDNTEKRKRNYIRQKIEEMENQLNELKKEL